LRSIIRLPIKGSKDHAVDGRENPRILRYMAPGGIILFLLFIYVWRFSLLGKKTLFFVDAVVTCLPLERLRSLVIHGQISPLWTGSVYGGHPMLAEGQVAYFNPLAMASAALANSPGGVIYGLNLYEFLCSVVGVIGILGLSRALGLSRWAAAFAALAIAFSAGWLHFEENAVLTGAFVWVPWCLWALEHWLKHPNVRSAALMGAALGGLLQSGYPQTFHATIIYMLVRLIPTLLVEDERRRWISGYKVRLSTGLLAVVLCIALAAVQLLPLLELTSLSQRHAGTAVVYVLGWLFYARGLFFSGYEGGQHYQVLSVGSLFVCAMASLLVLLEPRTRLFGHLLAAVVLITLGCGPGSPVFSFVYDHDLLPGLRFFRTTFVYLLVGTVGIGIAAAGAVDALARWRSHELGPILRFARLGGLAAAGGLWVWLAVLYSGFDARVSQFILPVAAVVAAGILAATRSLRFAGPMMVGLLLAECLLLRLHPVRQIEVSALAEPDSVRAIKAQPGWQDYRLTDVSSGLVFMLGDSWDAGAVRNFRRTMSAVSGNTAGLWGLHSMKGNLALPLARWKAAEPVMDDEIVGAGGLSPGLRLIDVLAVRYIAADGPIVKPAFREFWTGPDEGSVMENMAALPRFQIYDRQVFVDTPEAALEYIRHWNERVLVVEDPSHSAGRLIGQDVPSDSAAAPATFSLEAASDTAYRLEVSAARPCWLFLADSNYPGWRATIDGVESPVFSAQVLGKAVRITAGQHQVRIEFHSASFIRGAWISAVALLLTAYLVVFGWRRPRPGQMAQAC
jgi:hypothetical protein